MKIAICHYSCPPVVGGIEAVIEQQACMLKQHHHFIRVIAGTGSKFSQEIDVDINPLLSSGIMDMYQDMPDSDSLKLMEPQILSIMEYLEYSLSSFDILIAHNVLAMPYNIPLTHAIWRIAERTNIKVISWNHDSPHFHAEYAQKYPSTWEILKKASPDIRYVCVSPEKKDEFERLYGPDVEITVIENGISVSNFLRLQHTTHRLIGEKRLHTADLLMLQPSRFYPNKNIEFSVRVIKALVEKGIHAMLLLTAAIDPYDISTIEYHNRVKQMVRQEDILDHVVFIPEFVYRQRLSPTIDRTLLKDLYQISDILFLPSLEEGYGIPLLEAAIARLPIVCSDIPAFRQVCGSNACMFRLDESPEDVVGKILKFTQSTTAGMFKSAFHEHNWENIYHARMLPLLQDVMG
jgi:glycosyltransferase involved in cell wall biosynthesis